MATNDLKALHTALVDTKNGYEEAIRDADQAAAAVVFREMLALHARDHDEIHAALVAAGEKPDESGSFMSAIHQTVIKVRSAVTGLGRNAMPAFISGEEMLLAKYDDAVNEAADVPQRQSMLQRQKSALLAKIAQMKSIAI